MYGTCTPCSDMGCALCGDIVNIVRVHVCTESAHTCAPHKFKEIVHLLYHNM